MSREEEIKKGLFEHTLVGEAAEVIELTQEGIDLGMDPLDILFGALIPSLQEVGRLFEIGEYFVPEMLVAARAMQGAMGLLRPLLVDKGAEPIGKVVMLTVKGDVHDIGKNLCNIMLEGEGFDIVDLGVNVKPEEVVEAVQEHQPQLVGFSAFLTTTMPFFKSNLSALSEAGLRDSIRVMVGGAPVTQEYADSVGADGFAPDASATVRLAKELMTDMGYDVSMGGDDSEGASALASAVQAVEELMVKGHGDE
ncbi:MAG: corrinoid protein [Caldilineaceae bacterium]|nr:corrinoid protein [Caldilineaceae bacterium]MDE0070467.1 corrinoid protein [Caldilineaceae bacterium]MDE0430060.1 corrinoid protein [Caldilineaceae bacterium]